MGVPILSLNNFFEGVVGLPFDVEDGNFRTVGPIGIVEPIVGPKDYVIVRFLCPLHNLPAGSRCFVGEIFRHFQLLGVLRMIPEDQDFEDHLVFLVVVNVEETNSLNIFFELVGIRFAIADSEKQNDDQGGKKIEMFHFFLQGICYRGAVIIIVC